MRAPVPVTTAPTSLRVDTFLLKITDCNPNTENPAPPLSLATLFLSTIGPGSLQISLSIDDATLVVNPSPALKPRLATFSKT